MALLGANMASNPEPDNVRCCFRLSSAMSNLLSKLVARFKGHFRSLLKVLCNYD